MLIYPLKLGYIKACIKAENLVDTATGGMCIYDDTLYVNKNLFEYEQFKELLNQLVVHELTHCASKRINNYFFITGKPSERQKRDLLIEGFAVFMTSYCFGQNDEDVKKSLKKTCRASIYENGYNFFKTVHDHFGLDEVFRIVKNPETVPIYEIESPELYVKRVR